MRLSRPSPSMIVALVALLAALNGPALARRALHHRKPAHRARLLDGARIKPNSIASKQIRNGTLGRQDFGRGMLPDLSHYYTRAQSDAQFVNHVPGTLNVAPNAAALGGIAANRFLTTAQSDARYVKGVPGAGDEAPNAAALAGHPASDFALGGGRAGAASLSEPSGAATKFDLLAVPQLGTFKIDCTGSDASLYFDRDPAAQEVDLLTSAVHDPGATTSMRSDKVTGGELALEPTSARARWQIQALRPGDGRVATVTVSLTWHDATLAPSGCLALGEYHVDPA
jgi:hypothetical protein